jgi:branched-chain amino acid transport system ATP-binding protein
VYDHIIVGLRGVSLEVKPGQVVALLGANGAGKSTTLKAVAGLLPADGGALAGGRIAFAGEDITGRAPRSLVRGGLVQVLEGRHCFPHLTVEENLQSGALLRRTPRRTLREGLERVYSYFPRLAKLRKQRCGFASGGEQQMVAIGRALLARPRLLLLDEPSMGIAPQVVDEIFRILRSLNREDGLSILLAEQNAHMALAYADQAYVLENGRTALGGKAAELAARSDIQAFYLGLAGPTRAREPVATASS